jgi:YVTN family beta-propeller protein
VEFRVLGDLEVVEDGQALALGPHQQRAVLALLVLSAGEVVSSDRLIEALWGERPPPSAAKTVQVYISRLRKTLNGAQAGTSSSGELIVTVDHGYVLRVDREQVDVRAFERLLDQGRDAFADREFDAAATVLRQALGLWRGAPLADFAFDAFAAGEIARLQELRVEALEIRIDAGLALGRHAALVAELEALTTEHPLRERLGAARMLALYRCGREPEALALYRETRRLLVDELGMEPSPALRELHDAILRQDPGLKPPAAPRPHPTAGSDPRVRRRRRAALVAATLALAGGVAAVIALLAAGGAVPVHVAANSVAVIDPGSGRLLGVVAVGARPGPLAAAAGSVWVANLDDDTITGIDTGSRKKAGTFTHGGPISDMTAAGDSLWISEATVGVAKVDPTVKAVTKRKRVSVYDPFAPQSADASRPVAVGASSLWLGQYGAVTRMDSTGTRQARIVGLGNVDAIAVGAGATWASDAGNDVVSRISDRSVVDRIPTGDGPGAIAVGDGAVWVAERFDGKVARIDPSVDRVTAEIPVGAAPSAVAVIGDSVWVANSGDGTLSEIDARTNRVVHLVSIGNSPAALAAVAGRLWVSVQAPAASVASAVAGPTGGVARVAFKDDPGPPDPRLAHDSASWQILNATCAKLYNYPDASGAAASRIIPEVAAGKPAVSRDGLRYTFTIRPGFRFSPPSNAPVTAQTFRHLIERSLSPRWRASAIDPSDIPEIAGLSAYKSGQARHISGVSASGHRLVIRLTHPDAALPQRLALPFFCAVPDNAPAREAAKLPMAGPYYVRSYSPGKQTVLARNPNYRGHRPARLNTIDITIGAPPATSIARVIAGTEDYYAAPARSLNAMSPTEEARLQARYGAARGLAHQRFFENPSTQVWYLVFNTARGPFVNARLRRAVSFAIDRKTLVAEQGGLGPQRPTDQYLPPGVPGFRDASIYPPGGDLARARRLAGPRHHHATLITANFPPFPQRAQIVQATLATIGIDVDIEPLSVTQLVKREFDPHATWDLATIGWTPDFPDPSNVLNPMLQGPSAHNKLGNFAHFDDPAYNRRLDAAARLSGPARYTTYAKLDTDLISKAAPMAAVGVWLDRALFSARIGCQIYQPIYGIDLAALCIKRQ